MTDSDSILTPEFLRKDLDRRVDNILRTYRAGMDALLTGTEEQQQKRHNERLEAWEDAIAFLLQFNDRITFTEEVDGTPKDTDH